MIGVLAKAEDLCVVKELFELFKTPWELFTPGQEYDVLLVGIDELPTGCDAELILFYGSSELRCDTWAKFAGAINRVAGVAYA